MIKTVFKSAEEIRYSLEGLERVTIISCGTCANLSDTGGYSGIRYMRRLLEGWGKEVVAARCVATCCPEESTRRVLEMYRWNLARSDALLMLSCSGGVKAVFLCDPGIPVIPALDTMGSVSVSRREDPVAKSVCTFCDHCVIGYTGGICPATACPAGKMYGPCKGHRPGMEACVVDPDKECVWEIIRKRGDPDRLDRLAEIHADRTLERLKAPARRPTPVALRKISGWVVSRIRGFGRVSGLID